MFKEYSKKLVPNFFNARVDQAKYSMVIYLLKTLLNGSETLAEEASKPLFGLILASYFTDAPLKLLDDYPSIKKIQTLLKDELPDFSMDISFLTKMAFSIWILSINQAGGQVMITNQQFWLVLGSISAISTLNLGIEKREKIINKLKSLFNKSIENEVNEPLLLDDTQENEKIKAAITTGEKLEKLWSAFWEVLRFSALSYSLISKIMLYVQDVDATTHLLVRTVGAPLVGGFIVLLQKCDLLSMEQSMTLMNYFMALNLEWSTLNTVINSKGIWGTGFNIAYGLSYVPTLFTAINTTKKETQKSFGIEDEDSNKIILE